MCLDPGAVARILVRYATDNTGAVNLHFQGDGTALPPNSTVEIYELVVQGKRGPKGDTGLTIQLNGTTQGTIANITTLNFTTS